jgi:hypothetical protein
MARKVDSHAKPQPQPDAAAEDLNVLLPDVDLELAGRKLTVREYRFIGGLRARAKAKPLIDDLEKFVADGGAAEAGVEDYVELLAAHDVLVRDLMLDSIDGADADFIDALSEADGEALLLTWWGVCGRFFVRVVAARLRDRLLAQARRAVSAGPMSSESLPAPDMGQPANSQPATPSVS